MARKQWQRKLLREGWVDGIGATANRDTLADDIRVNLYAWKLSKGVAGPRCPRMRKDTIA